MSPCLQASAGVLDAVSIEPADPPWDITAATPE
jgi:hypothetical protein